MTGPIGTGPIGTGPIVTEPLGALLARLRLDRGWSQQRLAERLRAASGMPTVTRTEISRWERGRRRPEVYWLQWLAEVLDVPLDELLLARAQTEATCHHDRALARLRKVL